MVIPDFMLSVSTLIDSGRISGGLALDFISFLVSDNSLASFNWSLTMESKSSGIKGGMSKASSCEKPPEE